MVGKTALTLALFGAFGGTSAMGNDASPNLALNSHQQSVALENSERDLKNWQIIDLRLATQCQQDQ